MLHLLVLLGMLGGVALGLGLLFLPTLIAKSRNHPNTLAIFLVNLFLGWTFIGWMVALIWACTTPAIPVVYAPVYPAPMYPAGFAPGQPHAGYPPASGYAAPRAQVLPPTVPYPGPR